MFVIPALAALLTFVYLRPQEVVDVLRPLALSGMVGVVVYAYGLDLRLRKVRPLGSPSLALLLAMVALCVVTLVARAPDRLGDELGVLATAVVVFVAISEGVQSFRAIEAAAMILVALTIVVAAVGVQQGLEPTVCFQRTGHRVGTAVGDVLDGRPCTRGEDCEEGGVAGAEYLCEHPGLFDTHSIAGRVRFRGLLEDPNELCLALSMGAPLALGLYERRRSLLRLLVALLTFGLVIPCIVMTRSRSGQLSILAALGVYFLRRFGRRGFLIVAVLAVPLILLGGRSGAEADSSSDERLECWSEALSMWREYPLGVGYSQFTEHHYLTAHNSFLLALAELGPPGLVLWTASLYAAFKTTIRIHLDFASRPEASVARDWTYALTASLVGLTVSSVFLSLTYHGIVWIFLGLVAALYATVRRHEPGWRVRFTLRDLVAVCGIDVALVGAIAVYLRLKGV